MDKMSVCLLTDAFPPIVDGVANAVLNYAYNIEKEWGHAMVAAPSYPGADDSSFPFSVVRYPSIDVRKLTTGYTAGIPFSPELTSQMAMNGINILHAHAPMMSAIVARSLRKRMNLPTVITYHTKYDIDIANVVKNKAMQVSGIKSVVTNVSSFDEVWVVSEGAGQNLKSMGYQGDYIVMPNGVDLEKGEAAPEEVEKETGGYDLPEGVPLYLFVGRMMWYKGVRITLDALKKLKEQGKDFRMVLIGGGSDCKEIKAYTEELGLTDKVFFTGVITERERVKAWYTRADLFLFPSTFDSNGLVVREAAACNLASVLIKDSCAAEDVTDGRNAFLIDENADSMAQLLMKVSADPQHVKEVGINAGNDLYLSWEDAVIKAVERYRIVEDLYRIGAFKEHDRFADNLLATSGDLMITIGKLQQAFYQEKLFSVSSDGLKIGNKHVIKKNVKKATVGGKNARSAKKRKELMNRERARRKASKASNRGLQ